jgi:hypothetical protein
MFNFLKFATFLDRYTTTVELALTTFNSERRLFGSWSVILQRTADGQLRGEPNVLEADEQMYQLLSSKGKLRAAADITAGFMSVLMILVMALELWRLQALSRHRKVCVPFTSVMLYDRWLHWFVSILGRSHTVVCACTDFCLSRHQCFQHTDKRLSTCRSTHNKIAIHLQSF